MLAFKGSDSNKDSIHILIRKNMYSDVVNLLETSPELANQHDKKIMNNTPLITAAYDDVNGPEYIKLLLSYGADPNLRGKGIDKKSEGRIPFETAVEAGCYESAKLLIDGGTDLDIRCSDGKSILEKSFDLNEKLVCDLLAKGAVPQAEKLLFKVISMGYSGRLFLLLEEKGLDTAAEEYQGRTLVHYASKFGRDDILEYLIMKGLDVNKKDTSGQAPLHLSSEGSLSIMKIAGISGSESLPVYSASEKSVSLLIKSGADINAANNSGETPLHLAAQFGHLKITELLISEGADINAVTNDGCSPLHYAARGIEINIQNSDYPAYHLDNPGIVEFLIKSGSDPAGRNNRGETPYDTAIKSNASDEVKQLLSLQ